MSSTITFDAVTKQYPAGRGTESGSPAVDSFSARIEAGTTTVLLGSSGCGKTTLLRMVNRMVEPSSGRVLIDDADVATRDAVALRRSIGYVMQNAGLLPHRRVIDNITLVPRLQGADRHDARCRALELMDMLDLDRDLAGRYPHQLSGGQAQRVGVARALAADPEVLLMDEPFGAVDPLVRRDLQREMVRIQAELGKTIIFVTHDVDEAFLLGDQVAVLRAGGVLAQVGTPEELLSKPADEFVADFVGADASRRQLRSVERNGSRVVVDADGRPLGTLREDGGGAADGESS